LDLLLTQRSLDHFNDKRNDEFDIAPAAKTKGIRDRYSPGQSDYDDGMQAS
jgi:hypothetical protein